MNSNMISRLPKLIPIDGDLDCEITDVFTVMHKNAIFEKTINYANKTKVDIPIKARKRTFHYPFMCYDFSCFIYFEHRRARIVIDYLIIAIVARACLVVKHPNSSGVARDAHM